jgi:hypothetical protein
MKEPSSPKLEEKLKDDPDLNELLGIREKVIQRGMSRGVKGSDIIAAYISNNLKELNRLFGYTEEEIEALNRRINMLTQSLLRKYPELKNELDKRSGQPCIECSIDEIAAKWDRELLIYQGAISFAPEREPIRCKWASLAIDLVFCSLLPHPILVVLCGYKAVCGNCEGGILDTICI